jgi:NTE family protein
VISTISGGSVIGAYYAYTPHKPFEEFEADIREFLRRGFQRGIALELVKPQNLCPCLASFFMAQLQDAVARLGKRDMGFRRYPSRTDMFCKVLRRDVFPNLTMSSPRRNNLEVVIGACELRTGAAFRFGNQKSGSWRHGEMAAGDVKVALAVAASAAYPIFLPALDRRWQFRKKGQERAYRVLLTDGGVYDNLGIQVLEPKRDAGVSLHIFPCEYLIACNAGHGQESGDDIPQGFLTRVSKAFGVVHRRVQDSAMHRMHQLKEAGWIKGFAMPYLGQQDERLPWKPPTLVPRAEVMDYPTNFGRMAENWINTISDRGEQLTRALVSFYLQDLLE